MQKTRIFGTVTAERLNVSTINLPFPQRLHFKFVCKAFAVEFAQYKIGVAATDSIVSSIYPSLSLRLVGDAIVRERSTKLVSCYIGKEYNPLFLIIQEGFS